jgi:hypothetical protein
MMIQRFFFMFVIGTHVLALVYHEVFTPAFSQDVPFHVSDLHPRALTSSMTVHPENITMNPNVQCCIGQCVEALVLCCLTTL